MHLPFELKRTATRGLGLFASEKIKAGDVIESCPLIVLPPSERQHAEKTLLSHYMYPWRSTRSASVVFGYGSIINHSFDPNTDWKQDFRSSRMVYRALRDIQPGEEITINYNGEPDDLTPIEWTDIPRDEVEIYPPEQE